MDWTRRIDAYCERLSEAFWAEPFNAITNIAFIIAATVALMRASRQGRLDTPVLLLSLNAFAVGIGSFLFHTFATRWAAVADTGPIMLFILGYFTVALNRFGGLAWWKAALGMLGFLAVMIGLAWLFRILLHEYIGGSQSYFPALLALLAMGSWLVATGRNAPAGRWLMRGAGVFAVSLTFRTLDGPLCDIWPIGTHFMWHLLNGTLLGMLLWALIEHGRKPVARRVAAA